MSAPSFESDLRAAREAADVSIAQIQQETRIPADVIQRFEEGKLLTDPAFNEVYLKAFLRAYAGAVGLPPNRVADAYGAFRSGTYQGGLNPNAPPAPSTPPALAPEPSVVEAPEAEASGLIAPKPGAPPPPVSPQEKAPAVAALSRAPDPEATSVPRHAPNDHFPKRRVESAAVASAPRSFDRSWGTIIAATLSFVLVVSLVLWLLFRDTTPEPEEAVAAATDTTAATPATTADSTSALPTPSSGPPLASPIRVTVVAEGDGLQSFRVTELPGDRRPFWVEPGKEIIAESAEGVILWGEGGEGLNPAEVTLRWQGLTWKPAPGQILRITPQNGQRLLDSLATAAGR